jgi:hypothetical protein
MAWFKVDDKLHDHRKVRVAGVAAMGLWTLAGSWAADNLSDGFIPESICQRWDAKFRALAARLVLAGFWIAGELDGEAGWYFHDWKSMQPSRAEVLQKRAEARERMEKARAAKAARSREQDANVQANEQESSEDVRSTPTRPDPTRPLSTSVESPLGGHRQETLRPEDARCTTHEGVDEPPNCRGCMTARESLERQQTEAKRAKAKRVRECGDCDALGFQIDPDTQLPSRRCDHRRVS